MNERAKRDIPQVYTILCFEPIANSDGFRVMYGPVWMREVEAVSFEEACLNARRICAYDRYGVWYEQPDGVAVLAAFCGRQTNCFRHSEYTEASL